jgi:hypothetical protein
MRPLVLGMTAEAMRRPATIRGIAEHMGVSVGEVTRAVDVAVEQPRARPSLPPCDSCGRQSLALMNGTTCPSCFNGRERFTPAPVRERFAPAPAPKTPAKPDVGVVELSAWHRGMKLRTEYPGRTMGGIARELAIDVEYVPGTQLSGSTPTWMITGLSLPAARRVWVANDLPFPERERVLAHEIGHVLRLDADLEPWQAERTCNAFAFGFTGTKAPR